LTISSSRTAEFDVSEIVTHAYRLAGLLEVHQSLDTAQSNYGAQLLQLIVKSVATMGRFAKVMTTENVTLISGTRNYTLSTTTLDVLFDGAFVPVGQSLTAAQGETPIIPMSRDKWQGLSTHNAQGRPTEYFADRSAAQVVVYFWPTPDSGNAGTARMQVHRLRADVLDVNSTMEFETYWSEYFVCELASRLALSASRPLDLVVALKQEAKEKLDRARAEAKQHVSQQFVLAHRYGYRR
jgi:hypothetical protein